MRDKAPTYRVFLEKFFSMYGSFQKQESLPYEFHHPPLQFSELIHHGDIWHRLIASGVFRRSVGCSIRQ